MDQMLCYQLICLSNCAAVNAKKFQNVQPKSYLSIGLLLLLLFCCLNHRIASSEQNINTQKPKERYTYTHKLIPDKGITIIRVHMHILVSMRLQSPFEHIENLHLYTHVLYTVCCMYRERTVCSM